MRAVQLFLERRSLWGLGSGEAESLPLRCAGDAWIHGVGGSEAGTGIQPSRAVAAAASPGQRPPACRNRIRSRPSRAAERSSVEIGIPSRARLPHTPCPHCAAAFGGASQGAGFEQSLLVADRLGADEPRSKSVWTRRPPGERSCRRDRRRRGFSFSPVVE